MNLSPCIRRQSRVTRRIAHSEQPGEVEVQADMKSTRTESTQKAASFKAKRRQGVSDLRIPPLALFSLGTTDSGLRFTHCASDSDSSAEGVEEVFEFPHPPRSALEAGAFFSLDSHSAHSSVDSRLSTPDSSSHLHSRCSSPTSSGPPATPTSPAHSVKAQMHMRPVRPLSTRKCGAAALASSAPTLSPPCSSASTPVSLRSSSSESATSLPFHAITVQLEEQDAPDDEYYAAHARAFVTLSRPRLPPSPFTLLRTPSGAWAASPVSAGCGAEADTPAAPSAPKRSPSTCAQPSATMLCESGGIPKVIVSPPKPIVSPTTDTRGDSLHSRVRPRLPPPTVFPSPSSLQPSAESAVASSSHLRNSHLHPTSTATLTSVSHPRTTGDANVKARLCAFKFPESHSHSLSPSPTSSSGATAPPTASATNTVFSSSFSLPRITIAPSSSPTPSFSPSHLGSPNADGVSFSPSPSPAAVFASSACTGTEFLPSHVTPSDDTFGFSLAYYLPSQRLPIRTTGTGGTSKEGGEKGGELADVAADYAAYAPLLRPPTPTPSPHADWAKSPSPQCGGEMGGDANNEGEWDPCSWYADGDNEDEEEHELSPLIASAPSPFPFVECSSEDEDDCGATWRALASTSGSGSSEACLLSCAPLPVPPAPYRQTQHTSSSPSRRYSRHDATPELHSRWSSSTLSSLHSAQTPPLKTFSLARRYLGTRTHPRKGKASHSKPMRPRHGRWGV
ncbi:hypothetical protein MVEN_01387200 [Mycena venus]|uniref:Uncharacterized protein n=1 Tax=Mycena venus TaxID=2733690 RepID=A0A8H7CSH3_9AGAR|nr:hypothetical protein MVEN_01387200 [Mycena venus]